MLRLPLLIAVLLAALMGGIARAEPPPAAAAPDITVEARQPGERDRLIDALAPSRGGRQVARWEYDVCPNVVGLPEDRGSFLAERIQSVAQKMKLPVKPLGNCEPNVVVAVTFDPAALVQLIRKRMPELFGRRDDGAFRKSNIAAYLAPRPVRWLGMDETVADNGMAFSRIRSRTIQRLNIVYIIVDAGQLQQITWRQLADYLSVIALARPALDARYGDANSILSLFEARASGRPTPRGLTAYDWSFLRALYRSENRRSARSQQQAIRREMARDTVSGRE